MINEDLASTLGATQMMQQMMVVSREGAQRSALGGGETFAHIGSKDFLPTVSIVKDYEDLMKLKHGGTLRDSKAQARGAANLSPKQKVGMAMQKLEKLMRLKNQKLADRAGSGAGGYLDGSTDN